MIEFVSQGDLKKTESFLDKLMGNSIFRQLERYGAEGVRALQAATPRQSGAAASAWSYEVLNEKGSYSIVWTNSHTVAGVPLVILLQYGHGTGTGGYVYGRDFINPTMRPIFDRIADDVWKAVTSA